MASLKRIWTLSLACGGLFFCSHAAAQIAPGSGDKGDIATTSDKLDRDDTKRMTVLSGSVEALQNGARLVSDKLTIYSYGPGEGPNAQAKPPAPGGKAAGSTQDNTSINGVKQMIAEGHVFYVTQNENVRGDRMVYDAEPDTITVSGGVIAVQGKNVLRGDKMVIDRKTGLTTVASDATGRNNPNRVHALIYNDNNQPDQGQTTPGQSNQGQSNQGQTAKGQNAAKAPPAPAKKP
jgi:lipopolysaccharide export system protein LptA